MFRKSSLFIIVGMFLFTSSAFAVEKQYFLCSLSISPTETAKVERREISYGMFSPWLTNQSESKKQVGTINITGEDGQTIKLEPQFITFENFISSQLNLTLEDYNEIFRLSVFGEQSKTDEYVNLEIYKGDELVVEKSFKFPIGTKRPALNLGYQIKNELNKVVATVNAFCVARPMEVRQAIFDSVNLHMTTVLSDVTNIAKSILAREGEIHFQGVIDFCANLYAMLASLEGMADHPDTPFYPTSQKAIMKVISHIDTADDEMCDMSGDHLKIENGSVKYSTEHIKSVIESLENIATLYKESGHFMK